MFNSRAKNAEFIKYFESYRTLFGAVEFRNRETVNLSTRDHHHAVMIYKLEPTTGMLRTRAYIGQRLELYCSAMGKIFMAYEKGMR